MNVYWNDTFTGHWPVGTCAIVVARGQADAASQLEKQLDAHGLKQTITRDSMKLLDSDVRHVVIVSDGNY